VYVVTFKVYCFLQAPLVSHSAALHFDRGVSLWVSYDSQNKQRLFS
jgi:hypothetical protein